MINEDKKIVIKDEDGKEYVMEILFTCDIDERNASYVFVYDPENPEDIYPMRYTEDGELEQVEDEDELSDLEEILNTYEEDPKIQELKESK